VTRILGVDPGLVKTGWGVIDAKGQQASFVACGMIRPDVKAPLADRLLQLHEGLQAVIAQYQPVTAGLEETFVNVSGQSTLKLGQARGAILLSLRSAGLSVGEYAPNQIKKSITGMGKAGKDQVAMMVMTLLPQGRPAIEKAGEDARDALAVALTHSSFM
jgi:crossover junction endodeoxyribonuclease RuvC